MGGGIWSMHFIGMLAFEMGMPTSYEAGLTVLSLVIAIGATGGAFAWGRPTGSESAGHPCERHADGDRHRRHALHRYDRPAHAR